MAKFNRVLLSLIPESPVKEAMRDLYYRAYFNPKYARVNGFRVRRGIGHYVYQFDGGISFKCRENIIDELKRSCAGYIAAYRPKRGDTVVDGGAYVGEFVLYASAAVGAEGRVIAFEPDAVSYRRLIDNIALNGHHNITAIGRGLWSSTSAVRITYGEKLNVRVDAVPEDPAALPVSTLDTELERCGISRVDMIKLDVEGAEAEALKGAARTLASSHPAVAVASYHKVEGKETAPEVERILRGFGYETWTGHSAHRTTYGVWGGRSKVYIGGDYRD